MYVVYTYLCLYILYILYKHDIYTYIHVCILYICFTSTIYIHTYIYTYYLSQLCSRMSSTACATAHSAERAFSLVSSLKVQRLSLVSSSRISQRACSGTKGTLFTYFTSTKVQILTQEVPDMTLLRCPNLYFCTSKATSTASKLSSKNLVENSLLVPRRTKAHQKIHQGRLV